MSDEEFLSYINSAQNGTVPENQSEVQADDEQDGQDNSDNTGNAEPTDAAKAEPFKVFNTQEEYQSVIDGIIGERLKKNREGMETLEGLKQHALSFYDTDDGDAALRQLIDDLQQQNAEKHGVSAEEYRQQTQDSIDAQKYREEQSRISSEQQRIADIQSKWQRESEDLKRVIPDFDFAKAMQDKTFYDNIVNGSSVSTAYLAANKPAQEQPKPRRPIAQNGNMKGGRAGKVEANPASMSDADFARYIERIKG